MLLELLLARWPILATVLASIAVAVLLIREFLEVRGLRGEIKRLCSVSAPATADLPRLVQPTLSQLRAIVSARQVTAWNATTIALALVALAIGVMVTGTYFNRVKREDQLTRLSICKSEVRELYDSAHEVRSSSDNLLYGQPEPTSDNLSKSAALVSDLARRITAPSFENANSQEAAEKAVEDLRRAAAALAEAVREAEQRRDARERSLREITSKIGPIATSVAGVTGSLHGVIEDFEFDRLPVGYAESE